MTRSPSVGWNRETAHLEACAEEAPNDPVFMLKALGTVARAQHEPTGRCCRYDAGRAVQGAVREGNPSLANAMKVAKALGYRLALVPDRE